MHLRIRTLLRLLLRPLRLRRREKWHGVFRESRVVAQVDARRPLPRHLLQRVLEAVDVAEQKRVLFGEPRLDETVAHPVLARLAQPDQGARRPTKKGGGRARRRRRAAARRRVGLEGRCGAAEDVRHGGEGGREAGGARRGVLACGRGGGAAPLGLRCDRLLHRCHRQARAQRAGERELEQRVGRVREGPDRAELVVKPPRLVQPAVDASGAVRPQLHLGDGRPSVVGGLHVRVRRVRHDDLEAGAAALLGRAAARGRPAPVHPRQQRGAAG
mmetsp:Transcript_32547/g.96171  ORF Transcript_32547/g.96171 Transcript_32547/m.96171 type:complete len:272 (+) Transcript_32547:362-1177(+)